jgi:hypothetical protein
MESPGKPGASIRRTGHYVAVSPLVDLSNQPMLHSMELIRRGTS